MAVFHKLDVVFGHYYWLQGRTDYYNEHSEGKFLQHCYGHEYDIDNITKQEFEQEIFVKDPADCLWLDFDHDFPIPGSVSSQKQTYRTKQLQIFQKLYAYATHQALDTNLPLNDSQLGQLSKHDLDEAKLMIERHCSLLFDQNNNQQGLITMVALSKRLRIPLLSWIMNVHHRMIMDHEIAGIRGHKSRLQSNIDRFIEHTVHQPYNVDVTNYWLMQYLHKTSPKLYDIVLHAIPMFTRQLFPCPIDSRNALQTSSKYEDSIGDYYLMFDAINDGIRYRQYPPLQLDVWIIPRSVQHEYLVEGYCWTRCGKHMPSVIVQIIQHWIGDISSDIIGIGNVHHKLLHAQLKRISHLRHQTVDTQQYTNNQMRQQISLFVSNTIDNVPAYHRCVLIIDRRLGTDVDLYSYQTTSSDGDVHRECWQSFKWPNFCNSNQFILPGDAESNAKENRDIGLFDSVNGYMFGLSYHINATDSRDVYWSRAGSAYRINMDDVLYLWPKCFVNGDCGSEDVQRPMNVNWISQNEPFQRFSCLATGDSLA